MNFTDEEVERYARHLVLREIGGPGQQRLKAARVLIVGLGGLGAPAALYLAAAGVGTLGLADGDEVSLSNLQRQVLYRTEDVGRSKIEAAAEALARVNPHVAFEPHALMLDEANAAGIIGDYDVVLDGTDSFGSRFAVSDACLAAGKPLVSGAIGRWTGQLSRVRRPALLPLPGARDPAGRGDLLGRRRDGRAGRRDRFDDGAGGDQADRRRGRAPDRPAVDLRCAERDDPHRRPARRSRMPGLRRGGHFGLTNLKAMRSLSPMRS